MVAAVAVTLRFAKSFVALPNCSLKVFALLGHHHRHRPVDGGHRLRGENVAVASAMPTAMPHHLGRVGLEVAVRRGPPAVAGQHRGDHRARPRARRRPAAAPAPSSSVPTVTESRRSRQPLTPTPSTISRHSTEHNDTHHSGHAEHDARWTPARRSPPGAPGRRRPVTRQAFLIGSTPAARSAACRRRRRRRAEDSSARSAACRRRSR